MVEWSYLEKFGYLNERLDTRGFVALSLIEGEADYCFSTTDVLIVGQRLRNLQRISCLVTPIKESSGRYCYHMLPIKVYKKFGSQDKLIRGMPISADRIPIKYRCTYTTPCTGKEVIIKDYNKVIDYDTLDKIINYTNNRNY